MALNVECLEAGAGPHVVLIHSSVAGAGQWRQLMKDLSGQFHLMAINLYGYGATDTWDDQRNQTLDDQASLIGEVLPDPQCRFSIVGHSFGGSVAMKAAAMFADRVDRLVLIEPNPFYLLSLEGRQAAFAEAVSLRDCIKEHGATGDWKTAAAVFADYWTGKGSWTAMSDDRQAKFATALQPNYHEWDAVMNETTPLAQWRDSLPSRTTVISAEDTVRSIAEIVALLNTACPHWHFEKLAKGGHMAALTRPEAMTPLIKAALGQGQDPRSGNHQRD